MQHIPNETWQQLPAEIWCMIEDIIQQDYAREHSAKFQHVLEELLEEIGQPVWGPCDAQGTRGWKIARRPHRKGSTRADVSEYTPCYISGPPTLEQIAWLYYIWNNDTEYAQYVYEFKNGLRKPFDFLD